MDPHLSPTSAASELSLLSMLKAEAAVVTAAIVSKIIQVSETNVPALEALRKSHGADVVILYDVSPPGKSPHELFAELQQNPRVVILDHHNACSPTLEVQGKELTAAEVVVSSIPQMDRAGLLVRTDGSPAKVLSVTNALNVDPDAFISRFLIEAYANPELRARVWEDPAKLATLVSAAHYGDISFFGGCNPQHFDVETAPLSQNISLALFQLINDAKEALVIEHRQETAVRNHNYWRALAKMTHVEGFENKSVAAFEELQTRLGTATAESSLRPLTESADLFLREYLGNEYVTLDDLKAKAAARTLRSNADAGDVDIERQFRKYILQSLSRAQIREVFNGSKRDSLFGSPLEPQWNAENINRISSAIAGVLPALFDNAELSKALAARFVDSLVRVQEKAKESSTTVSSAANPEVHIGVTTAWDGRLDADLATPFYRRNLFVYDWIREASASFGDSWLHVMDRGGGKIVVSSRAARPDEVRPYINLAEPNVVAKLQDAECVAAAAVGASPTPILIKANLWLPLGSLHIPREELVELLLSSYESLVNADPSAMPQKRTFPLVELPDGFQIPFDGAYAACAHAMSMRA